MHATFPTRMFSKKCQAFYGCSWNFIKRNVPHSSISIYQYRDRFHSLFKTINYYYLSHLYYIFGYNIILGCSYSCSTSELTFEVITFFLKFEMICFVHAYHVPISKVWHKTLYIYFTFLVVNPIFVATYFLLQKSFIIPSELDFGGCHLILK